MNRRDVIDQVVNRLRSSKFIDKSIPKAQAIRELTEFFLASRNPWAYLIWTCRKAPWLHGPDLLELLDVACPEFHEPVHLSLVRLERKAAPGLVRGVVQALTQSIRTQAEQGSLGWIAELGAGGGEVIRQTLNAICSDASRKISLTLVGVDSDPAAVRVARENLGAFCKDRGIDFLVMNSVGELEPFLVGGKVEAGQSTVVYVRADALDFLRAASRHRWPPFSVVTHVFLRHHLAERGYEEMNSLLKQVARQILEYDTLRTWIHYLGATIENWSDPLLLQSAVFSALRGLRPSQLAQHAKRLGGSVQVYRRCWYLLSWDGAVGT